MIKISWLQFKNYVNGAASRINFLEDDRQYKIFTQNGSFSLSCLVPKDGSSDQLDFENNYKNLSTTNSVLDLGFSPFASKQVDGKKLFQRVHGVSESLSAGQNTFEFVVPYAQVKFNEIEIVGAELGDFCDLNILDSATGLISTIPNLKLNQFGFHVNIRPVYYQRASNYDADLYGGMKISVTYNSQTAKTVHVNYVLHEVKD
jgi:hypothetical protein